MRGNRWAFYMRSWNGPMGKVQVHFHRDEVSARSAQMPEPVLRLAQAEYDRQFPGQPYERMQERGGLSVHEVIGFLADRVEYLESKLGGEHG